ncbi:MAG: triose-phosphate isomerase [Oligoflexales bacterium]|nr:triose-phosphate isomerase [Oligoflexales bacterium]
MRKQLLAGNWKMNGSVSTIEAYFSDFRECLGLPISDVLKKVDICFAVPFTLLAKAKEVFKGTDVQVAAQNCHFEEKGAYTGEVSLGMLAELGINSSLVAHSERRQYYNETDQSTSHKVKCMLDKGFIPILCVGETQAEREQGLTNKVLESQLSAVFACIDKLDSVVIAYEPVWAIGTGLAATPELADEAHRFIREFAKKRFGGEAAAKLKILYGGSMKPENTDSLLAKEHIDGGLVGGASLKPSDFASMVKSAYQRA